MKKNRKISKKRLSKKTGMPPGSLVYVGDMDVDETNLDEPIVTLVIYDAIDLT